MRRLCLALAATALLAITAPAVAGPTEVFHAMMDEYWAAYLKDNPIGATQAGVTTYDRELGTFTLAEFDRQTNLPVPARLADEQTGGLDPEDRRGHCRRHRPLLRPHHPGAGGVHLDL